VGSDGLAAGTTGTTATDRSKRCCGTDADLTRAARDRLRGLASCWKRGARWTTPVRRCDGLVHAWNTVIVVDHDLSVGAQSDWVIDVGLGAVEERVEHLRSGAQAWPYYQHQLVRIYILVGEPDRAIDPARAAAGAAVLLLARVAPGRSHLRSTRDNRRSRNALRQLDERVWPGRPGGNNPAGAVASTRLSISRRASMRCSRRPGLTDTAVPP
jgi:hypothetical protein